MAETNELWTIAPVSTPEDVKAVARLFADYAASLDIDLTYQAFDEELASLPGQYAPPFGALLLARNLAGRPLGCVALRPFGDAGACEMKRLYVAPSGRGSGVGRALALAIVAEGRRIGYREMLLDTLPVMRPAIGLYRALGFRSVEPYYDTPVPGTIFLRLDLDS
jgi:ribosomal protein S18 acetylase RimI-like enzyme